MNIDFIFKIAAIGIIVAVLSLVLSRSGREEQAMMTTLAGLVVVLLMLVDKISELFYRKPVWFLMEILTLCAAALTAVIAAVGLKKYSPETSILIAAAGGILIILAVLPKAQPAAEEIKQLISLSGLNTDYGQILIKTIGICLIGKFTSEFCIDNGYSSLGSKIDLAAKISVLVISLPLYGNILETVSQLLAAGG